ncbi:MAG: c-type cytochrome [Gammaproteobacteria bacterium]|nr:c-type cytochrome [Gammaproteobacteria bacterium]
MSPQFKHILVIVIVLLSGLSGFIFSYYNHSGSSQLQSENATQLIETYHYPAIFVQQLKGDAHAGQKIFKEFCASCHAAEPLIDINAPHIGDKQAWKGFRSLGMDAMLTITINGAGAMPARGGCFECSDEQLRETINYILDLSR